jgi:trehalose 6-phosphate synthase
LFLGEGNPLVLSINAGAYEQLESYVSPVHPFDVEATSAALLEAMDGNGVPADQVAGRRRLLNDHGAAEWLDELSHDDRARTNRA